MVQRVEEVPVCENCDHPKFIHEPAREDGVPPVLLLHARCLARGCDCTGYVGVLWERQAPRLGPPVDAGSGLGQVILVTSSREKRQVRG